MARTKPLEEDEPLTFARGVLDQIIAKHDPETSCEQGKNPHVSMIQPLAGIEGEVS